MHLLFSSSNLVLVAYAFLAAIWPDAISSRTVIFSKRLFILETEGMECGLATVPSCYHIYLDLPNEWCGAHKHLEGAKVLQELFRTWLTSIGDCVFSFFVAEDSKYGFRLDCHKRVVLCKCGILPLKRCGIQNLKSDSHVFDFRVSQHNEVRDMLKGKKKLL